MRRNVLAGLFFVASLLPNLACLAAVQVSNLAEPVGVVFNTFGVFEQGTSFTTDGNAYTLNSLKLSHFSNFGGVGLVKLYTESAGHPGTLLESFGPTTIAAGDSLITYNSIGTGLLANNSYWVTYSSGGDDVWC